MIFWTFWNTTNYNVFFYYMVIPSLIFKKFLRQNENEKENWNIKIFWQTPYNMFYVIIQKLMKGTCVLARVRMVSISKQKVFLLNQEKRTYFHKFTYCSIITENSKLNIIIWICNMNICTCISIRVLDMSTKSMHSFIESINLKLW